MEMHLPTRIACVGIWNNKKKTNKKYWKRDTEGEREKEHNLQSYLI